MKHLLDFLTLRHRCPLFRSSVHLSTFMSKFDIYVKASILINYKTKQPSNLAWHISLTWLCEIGFRFSVHLAVLPSINSSVMLKFDIYSYVKVSILINYKTKQSSNLAWNISLTTWLCNKASAFPFVCPFDCPFVNIYAQVRHLCQS